MEDTAQYEQLTKEELIQVIVDLKKEIEALKHPVPKDSRNSSIPSSKDLIPRTRVSTGKEWQESRGPTGTSGSSPRTPSSPRRHRHGPSLALCWLWCISLWQRRKHWSNRPTSRYPCHHSVDHRVATSHYGLCLWTRQLSAVTHPRRRHDWARDGSLDHLFQCGTQPSL